MTDTPEHDEPAQDPAAAHGYTLAQLVEENAERQRDQAAAVFGVDPNPKQHDEESK